MPLLSDFNIAIYGPPPGPDTVGTYAWCDLGLIPTGQFYRFLRLKAYSPGKSVTFELRSSLTGKSAQVLSDTKLLYSCSVSPTAKTNTFDLYKSGRLNIATVTGTGVEHFFLYIKSKASTQAAYNYVLEFGAF